VTYFDCTSTPSSNFAFKNPRRAELSAERTRISRDIRVDVGTASFLKRSHNLREKKPVVSKESE
jgi:hypothetical protein